MEIRHIQYIFWLYELPKSAEPNFVDLTVFMLKDEIGAGFEMNRRTNYPIDGNNIEEICKEHNDKEVIVLLQKRQQTESMLNRRKHSSKLKCLLSFIDNILVFFEQWYEEIDIPFPTEDIIIEKPKPIYQQFRDLFNQFYEDPNADAREVKATLYRKPPFSNASKYLHDSRRAKGLTVEQLKSQPGFSWIDPLNTSTD